MTRTLELGTEATWMENGNVDTTTEFEILNVVSDCVFTAISTSRNAPAGAQSFTLDGGRNLYGGWKVVTITSGVLMGFRG